MELSYWQARWQNDKTGWHMQQVYPHLKTYWPKLNLTEGATVLIPLCGKTLDMRWLQKRNLNVIGVELSTKAVETFFRTHQLSFKKKKYGSFSYFEGENISIWNGDFFKLEADELPAIDAIYDKAALIALPPDRRPPYARHLLDFCHSHTQILMNTFEYKQEEMTGPPFSVPFQEVQKYYGKQFYIELLHETDILDELPRFKSRGLRSYLKEKFYHLKTV
jgi:thiopurine S-methyltransferase